MVLAMKRNEELIIRLSQDTGPECNQGGIRNQHPPRIYLKGGVIGQLGRHCPSSDGCGRDCDLPCSSATGGWLTLSCLKPIFIPRITVQEGNVYIGSKR